ncbi:UbiA family prenyltransferase [Primorskyibacter sp. S187A]|uniref:UbiA family prenyltransferase n=1 Tax=Primorskyibacter sp. S187A TaxID=3415130 RepID=UPI003C7CA28B
MIDSQSDSAAADDAARQFSKSHLPAIVVDLDDTLVQTDTLVEALLHAFGRAPLATLSLFARLWRDRAQLKAEITKAAPLDIATLPYNEALVAWLRSQSEAGREIILATAADRSTAQQVADHLKLFDTVLASDGQTNLKGAAKRDAIRAHLAGAPYVYVGDCAADLPLWQDAAEIGAVNAGEALVRKISEMDKPVHRFDTEIDRPAALWRGMRPYQWVKNILVFLPLLAAHQWGNPGLLAMGLGAFVAFSLAASAVYLINDLLDIQDDRSHREKRHRPIAAGRLRAKTACVAAAALFVLSLVLAALVSPALLGILLIYVAATFAYSILIKTKPAIDVLWLAGLYTTRVLAGAAATGIVASYWLLAFSIFVFLSLACAKRCSELQTYFTGESAKISRRGYRASDIEVVTAFGVASAFSSVIMLLLYLQDDRVIQLYSRPELLILVGALLLYWLCRVWIKVKRDELSADPIVFALKDRISRFTGLAIVLVFIISAGL